MRLSHADQTLLFPAGTWLVHDPVDVGLDYSIWQHNPGERFDRIIVTWTGVLADYTIDHRPMNERFIRMRLFEEQVNLLLMAAAHNVFRSTAVREWQRMMV